MVTEASEGAANTNVSLDSAQWSSSSHAQQRRGGCADQPQVAWLARIAGNLSKHIAITRSAAASTTGRKTRAGATAASRTSYFVVTLSYVATTAMGNMRTGGYEKVLQDRLKDSDGPAR